MKLRRLELENFRQFYGQQGLSFSTDPNKNVTLVYGSNGAGKTTILNAFTWGLYGETTPGLAGSEWLVNNLAWSEAQPGDTVTARVKVEFEDRDHIYELTREQAVKKGTDGGRQMISDGSVTVNVTDSSGQNERIGNPDGAIGSILPKRLYRFAFFDGERDIEYLASAEATDKIEDAIKTVLGLEVIERAIVHTKKARTSVLNAELSDAGDANDLELSKRITRLNEESEQVKADLDQLQQNLASSERELSRLDEALTKIEAAKELQERRKEIEAAISTANARIAGADRGLDEQIRRVGFLAFVPALIDTAEKHAEGLHASGEIPAPIKHQFVQELLDHAECICGTELKEGSPEQEAVMAWFAKAGMPDIEARWSRVKANALSFQARRDELYRYLNETLAEQAGFERERRVWQQKASDIEEEWTEVDDEEVRQINSKRSSLIAEIKRIERQIGGALQRKEDLDEAEAQANAEIKEAEGKSELAARARRRIGVAQEAEEIAKQILALRTRQTREDLEERIKKVFGDMCFRPYVPVLSERFGLTLSAQLGGDEIPVATSTGESQILALSFVGAMAELARKRYEESQSRTDGGLLNFQGGVFPLVLDAVFGNLDDTYQNEVAASLPGLAPQVIVLVTRGSAVDAIRERLWPITGKTAVCTLYTSAEGEEDAEVKVPTGSVPYRVAINEERDRSEIVEL